ncbi:ester cyclase [Guptibacillus hwajinpoensis]|uniref:ester cyclase n=1 Tax=Guptibacillus hwajinpoensis TaxID=208199 RepID=UPI001CFE71A5|nr:ester cyclase [Pseudalkalibacillus hwajinpoensis]WLR59099.1 ester cyclase [Pseudalkalibacillus hwajinpoensis]
MSVQNKQLIYEFTKQLYKATPETIPNILRTYYHEDAVMYTNHPFNELTGIDEISEVFYKPLVASFPDLHKQSYIVMAGEYEGESWVSTTGNMVGTFTKEWVDIPPHLGATWIRYGEFHKMKEGKIVETRMLVDMLDVMRQAGFRFIPTLAPEITVPGPSSYDGVLLGRSDEEESQKSLQLVEDMIFKGLKKASSGLEKQGLEAFWADDFMWYGPAGIGSTKGIQGFKDYHQGPFVKALPDRVGGHNHAARFADQNYIASTGWPSVEATHTGVGWLGIPAPNRKVSMRVMDWWRRDGDLLVENWVLIDIVEYLLQLDIDIFDRLRKRQYLIR